MNIRKLTADEVEFTIEIGAESIPIADQFETGDASQDQEIVDGIQKQLDAGNLWAWCCVQVTARWGDWTATDYLGACSYASEAKFRADGYWADMQASTLEQLNVEIARTAKALSELETKETS